MKHQHQHEFERDQPRGPVVGDTDPQRDGKAVLGRTLSPRNILQLQRTVGNQAVLSLLSHQQGSTVQRDTPERKTKAPPTWLRSSSANPIPGEPVLGITDRQPPFTEKDREMLKEALYKRHQENAQQGPDFAANFASALLEIWTGYVTHDMEETADDASWSMLTKLLLFVLKESAISFLFSPYVVGELTLDIARVLKGLEKSVAAGADLGQDAIENASTNSTVAKRGQELRNMTGGLGANLQMVIRSAMQEVGDSFYYRDWLDGAPLDDLHLFRLPRAIPVISRDQLGVMIAQHLTGLIHDQEDTWVDKHRENYFLLGDVTFNWVKNGIFVKLAIDKSGQLQTNELMLDVPGVLYKELEGHSISDMPEIPMYIELQSLPVVPNSKAIEELENAWPSAAPLVIKVPSDGKFYTLSGGLREMFYLYSLTNPQADLDALAMEYTLGEEGHSAADLYAMFLMAIEDGAKDLLDNAVKPLKIPPKPKR